MKVQICPQPRRSFARKINSGIAGEFGQQDLNDDEFLPEKEQAEIEHQTTQESTISLDMRATDMLKHNEDVGGTIFKYDLPVVNASITFKSK